MLKNIALAILKYIFYTILLAILLAILAKTHNMPAAFPEEYTEKIIELTDKFLISLNLIKDERLKAKYFKSEITGKKITKVTPEIERNIFSKIFNYILANGYDIKKEEELNIVSKRFLNNANEILYKLQSIGENPYIKSLILNKDINITDFWTLNFLNSIIKDSKILSGFVIHKNQKIINFIKKEDFNIMPDEILKLKTSENGLSPVILNGKNYFIYDWNSEQNYSIRFVIIPEIFFNTAFENSLIDSIFILDENFNVIFSSITENEILNFIKESVPGRKFIYNKTEYKIIFTKILFNYFIGRCYPTYPFWKILLNILKIIFIIVAIITLAFILKQFYLKLKEYKKSKEEEDSISILAGALMEMMKSLKYSIEASSKLSYNRESIDINSLVEKISQLNLKPEKEEVKKEEEEQEWYLIE